MRLSEAAEKALKVLTDYVEDPRCQKEIDEAVEALRHALAVDLAKVGEVGIWGEKPPTKRDNLSWVGITKEKNSCG